jgi:serine/threonine-protein kinase RsbT
MPNAAPEETREASVSIESVNDIVTARRQGRTLAERMGFSSSEATLLATAISELARNIVAYAQRGEVVIRPTNHAGRQGVVVIARDDGPGISDVKLALQQGYSTSGGLGLGLPGVRRIMDSFTVDSGPGRGTTITVTKWKI